MNAIEKYTRTYCKTHGIRYQLKKDGFLYTWSPITRSYTSIFYINNHTTNEIRIAIENHIAIFLK
jgi:hypothetical protein